MSTEQPIYSLHLYPAFSLESEQVGYILQKIKTSKANVTIKSHNHTITQTKTNCIVKTIKIDKHTKLNIMCQSKGCVFICFLKSVRVETDHSLKGVHSTVCDLYLECMLDRL